MIAVGSNVVLLKCNQATTDLCVCSEGLWKITQMKWVSDSKYDFPSWIYSTTTFASSGPHTSASVREVYNLNISEKQTVVF